MGCGSTFRFVVSYRGVQSLYLAIPSKEKKEKRNLENNIALFQVRRFVDPASGPNGQFNRGMYVIYIFTKFY